jgi:hypothetical protein
MYVIVYYKNNKIFIQRPFYFKQTMYCMFDNMWNISRVPSDEATHTPLGYPYPWFRITVLQANLKRQDFHASTHIKLEDKKLLMLQWCKEHES